MPNIKSAMKRVKTSAKSHAKNKAVKSLIFTTGKKLLEAVTAKDKKKCDELLRAFSSALDKAAKKGVITANTASRKKSRAALRIAKV
jgi:small subunit ribosomal protein S20